MKPGPKKRAGARYPSGRLKPYQADVSPTLVRRMRDMARDNAANPNLGTPIGSLYLAAEITHAQMAAGLEFARLRARYDRAIDAPRRTCASPSYGAAFGQVEAAPILAEELLAAETENTIREFEAAAKVVRYTPTMASRDQFDISGKTTTSLALLDRVCVENEHPTWYEKQCLLPLLTALAAHFRLTTR